MIRFYSLLCICVFFTACATNRSGLNSAEIIHDFFYPEFYSDRPCRIVDTVYLPVDRAYLVKASFFQIIDTAFLRDVSDFLDFTRPCGDTTRTLEDDLFSNLANKHNCVFVADTHFSLDGYFFVYEITNHKCLDQLCPNGKIISWAKETYGYSCTEELLPYLNFLTKRCDSIVHQYSIVYADHNIDMDNLSLPMNYLTFVVLPTKEKIDLLNEK